MALLGPSEINLILTQFIPFTIIFVLFYLLFEKTKVFGEYNSPTVRGLTALMSVAISALIVFLNPLNIQWTTILGNIFGGATILGGILAFIVIFALMIGAARQEKTPTGRPRTGVLTIIIAAMIGLVLFGISDAAKVLFPGVEATGQLGGLPLPAALPYIVITIFVAVLAGIVFYLNQPPPRE